jgi:hypothetical protein
MQKHGKTAQGLYNLASCCAKLSDYGAALAAGQELLELGRRDDSLYSIMACASAGVGDFEGAQRYGELSLTLKDADTPAVPLREFPQRKIFDPGKKTRNIISFSLFGQTGRYLRGAVRNALLAHDLYPSWTCRFYLDESVPKDVTELLRELRAQIVVMPRPGSPFEGLAWRFQVWDDQDVDFCMIRDCDSVLSVFEAAAVNEWLRSERWFHVMRAWYTHTDLILAGLWGGATGMLNNLHAGYVQSLTCYETKVADQEYLRKHAWPVVKHHVLTHDRFFRLPGAEPFPDAEFWPGDGWHIGMNEAAGSPDTQDLLLQVYCKRCPSLRRAHRTQDFSVTVRGKGNRAP